MCSKPLVKKLSSFNFQKSRRLLNTFDYSAVFNDAPFRASTPQILILSRPAEGQYARMGVIVAKKHVRKACKRNTFKRVVRESFRLTQHKIPPIDAIVLARKGADTLSKAELAQALDKLWIRVVKKALKPVTPPPEKM